MQILHKIFSLLLVLAVCPALICCNGDKKDANGITPLPTGYPRLAVKASDSMVVCSQMPVNVNINPFAKYEDVSGENKGLTVTYPEQSANIYFTFIKPQSPGEKEKILTARQERIGLNLNGAPAQTYHSTRSAAADGVLIVSETGSQTPVQLLANVDGYVVTATAFIPNPRAAVMYDSIRPLIEVLEHDLRHAFNSLIFETRDK